MSRPLLQPSEPSSRDKILEVAEALFARSGFAGVGLREVADRSGLGKSSLFHHFSSKMQLHIEVMRHVLERIRARTTPALRGDADPTTRLDAWVDALVDSLVEPPTTARLLLRALFEDDEPPAELEAQAAEVEALLAATLGEFQALVREGTSTGHFRPVSPAQATQTLIGTVVYHFASGELGESITGAPLFSAESIRLRKEEVRTFLLRGLAASAATD